MKSGLEAPQCHPPDDFTTRTDRRQDGGVFPPLHLPLPLPNIYIPSLSLLSFFFVFLGVEGGKIKFKSIHSVYWFGVWYLTASP